MAPKKIPPPPRPPLAVRGRMEYTMGRDLPAGLCWATSWAITWYVAAAALNVTPAQSLCSSNACRNKKESTPSRKTNQISFTSKRWGTRTVCGIPSVTPPFFVRTIAWRSVGIFSLPDRAMPVSPVVLTRQRPGPRWPADKTQK